MNDQQRSVIHENMAKKLHAMCLACTSTADIIEVFSVTGGLADLLPEELAVLLDQVSGQAVRNMTAHVVDSVKVERVIPTIKPEPVKVAHKPIIITAAPNLTEPAPKPEPNLTEVEKSPTGIKPVKLHPIPEKLNLFHLFQQCEHDYAKLYESLYVLPFQSMLNYATINKLGQRRVLRAMTHVALAQLLVKYVKDHTPEPEYMPEPEVMAEFDAFLDETL